MNMSAGLVFQTNHLNRMKPDHRPLALRARLLAHISGIRAWQAFDRATQAVNLAVCGP